MPHVMDFTSAFNTGQPQILKERVQDLGVSSWLILWIEEFLKDRPQRVCVDRILSDYVVLNCVLSPSIFSVLMSFNVNRDSLN